MQPLSIDEIDEPDLLHQLGAYRIQFRIILQKYYGTKPLLVSSSRVIFASLPTSMLSNAANLALVTINRWDR